MIHMELEFVSRIPSEIGADYSRGIICDLNDENSLLLLV